MICVHAARFIRYDPYYIENSCAINGQFVALRLSGLFQILAGYLVLKQYNKMKATLTGRSSSKLLQCNILLSSFTGINGILYGIHIVDL